MKGPGMRIDLDVRRHWRCDVCNTQRQTPGRVTLVRCHFCQDHPLMTLIESRRPDRKVPPQVDLFIDLHPDDVEAPAFVPAHLREPEESAERTHAGSQSAQPPQAGEDQAATKTNEAAEASAGLSEPNQTTDAPRRRTKRRKKGRRKRRKPDNGGNGSSPDRPPTPGPD